MTVDARALVRNYLREVFSEGRLDRMDAYLAGERFMAGVVELVTRWRSAFSDFNEAVEEAYVDGDRVITVSVLTGTHDGVLESRLGPIEPTGRSVRWSRIAIRRLDGDRFADGFFEEDEVGLLEQLGALDLSSGSGRGRHSPLAKPPERLR
jgi:predicted ester cyclase